jgi:hypothetical protein
MGWRFLQLIDFIGAPMEIKRRTAGDGRFQLLDACKSM